MSVADIAFFCFAVVTVTAGLFVTVSRNPVHSVLWLILAFLSSAGLFVLLGAEFVAMLLIIVYVGAVAVLFLFVVMMLDVDFAELKGEMARTMPLALLIGVIIILQFGMAYAAWVQADGALGLRQSVTHGSRHGDGVSRVAVHTDRVGPDGDSFAADRGDVPRLYDLDDPGCSGLGVVQDGARQLARRQVAVVGVSAVGVDLAGDLQA